MATVTQPGSPAERQDRASPPSPHADPGRGQGALAWVALVLGLLVVPMASSPWLPPMIRLPIVLAFVCVAPGAAFVAFVRMGDPVSSWTTSFVLSLALNGIVASAMVWTGWWYPAAGFALLAVPTAALAAMRIWPDWRRRRSGRAQPPTQVAAPRRQKPAPPAGPEEVDLLTTWLTVGQDDRPSVPPGAALHAAAPYSMAGRDDATALIPRIPAGDDGTALIPRIPAGDDGTALIPRIPASGEDHTALIPRQRGPARSGRVAGVGPSRRTTTSQRRGSALTIGLGVAALLLWIVSLAFASLEDIGTYGLLPLMTPTYFVALGLCAAGFVIELGERRRRGWVLLGHTAVLMLIMRATVPLLASEPQYAWTYKHVGVAELFRTFGRVTNPEDIYQQWPTLFALVAHVTDGSGVDAMRLAAWAPLFFNVAFCVPLFAVARTLATDPRVPYLTVFLYTGTNWVGQDYLSPQAFAFTLALGTIFVIIRWLRRTPGSGRFRIRPLEGLWGRIAAGLAPVPYTSARAAHAATAAMSVVFVVVVAAHQLTPYLVAMMAVGLVGLGLVRSYRIIPIILALAAGYLIPRYDVVDDYGLFQGFNFFSNARSVTTVGAATATASEGRVFNVNVTMMIALIVWGLAALAVVSSLRRLGPVAVPALLAFAPFGLLLAQSYGGEAIFRVYLFSAPWCAYLIATLVLRRRWLPRIAAVPAAAAGLTLAVLATVQAGHGQLMTTVFTRDDVAVARYLYSNIEPDAAIVLAASNFPTRLTPDYGRYWEQALIGPDARLGLFELSDAGADALDSRFDDSVPTYLVFSPSMWGYLEYYGYMPVQTLETLERQIMSSPRWEVFHRVGEAVIFRRAPGQGRSLVVPPTP